MEVEGNFKSDKSGGCYSADDALFCLDDALDLVVDRTLSIHFLWTPSVTAVAATVYARIR